MKIITLWQPFATLIQLKMKTIETRWHPHFACLNSQIIGIHAGGKWDNEWEDLCKEYLTSIDISFINQLKTENKIPFKAIIATAFVKETKWLDITHSKKALVKADGRFGLILENIQSIKPIYISGKQGIWNYEI